jgi:glycosyltransferase involved in cell wall biosynthesis
MGNRLTRRPSLLFLCQTLPFPPDGGVWIRTYHVLRLLARTFRVTALCFERAGAARMSDAEIDASCRALRQLADVEIFRIPQQASAIRFGWDHTRSVLSRQVYTRFLYESRTFRQRLRQLMATRTFDLVHVDSLDLAAYLPDCRAIPTVVVHHDIESQLLRRRADVEPRRWRRAYLRHQAGLMRQTERRWCPWIALNVVMSDHDACLLERIAPGSRVAIVPNGVDLHTFAPGRTPDAGIAFVGGTTPAPNADALRFFSTDVLPHIRAAMPDVPVTWIGRATSAEQLEYHERHRIQLTGYVTDPVPSMQTAACHVVPLRIGGGTRLKILNAWAMGKAVVTTSIGCEGLDARDDVNALIRNEPGAFAEAVVAVLRDHQLRSRLGDAGRATAEALYSWDAIGDRMTTTYLGLANPKKREEEDARTTLRQHASAARA